MTNINDITADGINLPSSEGRTTYLSAISLKLALQGYFATQHDVSPNVFLVRADGASAETDEDYSTGYTERCFETIIHLQHFAELVCKDLLRTDHPLLAVDAFNNPLLLYKLIHGERLTSEEVEGLRTIEFREALERACAIAKNGGSASDSAASLFLKWREPLTKLNVLRNRLWHRGTFVLRYAPLDLFVGIHVLPFVREVVQQPWYSHMEVLWKYKPLDCGIDPIEEIVKETRKGETYSKSKVALLKEFAGAAYKNPIIFDDHPVAEQRNHTLRETAEKTALAEVAAGLAAQVLKCPVCGFHSLLADMLHHVECTNCSLSVWIQFGDPESHGLHTKDRWFEIT
ncbi:MAG TPA: hypothetical protein VI750_02335 [Pyrinomonadaceae bacterium]|nr:hypothetical protein [Pyrinomonadaceae bacterium]